MPPPSVATEVQPNNAKPIGNAAFASKKHRDRRMKYKTLKFAAGVTLQLLIANGLLLAVLLLMPKFISFDKYSLLTIVQPDEMNPFMELTRWTVTVAAFWNIQILRLVINRWMPIFFSNLILSMNLSGSRFQGFSKILELISFTWSSLSLCISLLLSVAWTFFFFKSPVEAEEMEWYQRQYHFYVLRASVMAFLVSLCFWLLAIIFAKISINFHDFAYKDRLLKCDFCIWFLLTLEKEVSDRLFLKSSTKKRKTTVSFLHNYSPKLYSTLLKSYLNPNVLFPKSSLFSAAELSAATISVLCPSDRTCLLLQDFAAIFDSPVLDKLHEVIFKSVDSHLSSAEFEAKVHEVLEEHAVLLSTISDHNKLIRNVYLISLITVLIGLGLLVFPVMGLPTKSVFAVLGPLFVGLVILMGPSIKAIVDSLVFIFGTHPYDVGDRVFL